MEPICNIVLAHSEESRYKPKFGEFFNGEYFIKVNLPNSKASFNHGNGEGCWVKVDEYVCRVYDEDGYGDFTGELANDSIYYPGLDCGTVIPFRMRGPMRPCVPFGWLEANYGPSVW